jgi:hypothetical protein
MAEPWGMGTYELGKALVAYFTSGDKTLLDIAANVNDGLYTQRVMDAMRDSRFALFFIVLMLTLDSAKRAWVKV